MASKIYLLLVLGCFLLISCDSIQKKYTLATGSKESRHYQVGADLKKLIESKTSYKIILDTVGEGSISNCGRLMEGQADLALAQNDVPIPNSTGNLRTLLPLYPQLFLILYADSLNPESLRELIIGRKIAIGPKSGGTANFTRHFLRLMGIDSTEYRFVYSGYQENQVNKNTPISISVTGLNNERILKMLATEKIKLWSLDEPEKLGRGTIVEGLCLQYPYARPYIIPKNAFKNHPDKATLTVALDNVLLANSSVDKHVVYDLVNAILSNKEMLVQKDALYNFIHDGFNKESLQFPLHEGTKDYLERDQPSFFERYADFLALILTILTILIGAFSTLIRWNSRRKKERIDMYYQQVIDIENKAKKTGKVPDLNQYIDELDQLRQRAFSQLVNEKLQADDSFRIFITLIQDVLAIIQHRMDVLKDQTRRGGEQ